MKSSILPFKRLAAWAALLLVCLPAAANAQTQAPARIQIENLDRLSTKAVEIVNVNLSESLLKFGEKILNSNDPDEKKAAEAVAGIKGVYVKVLEFAEAGAYAESDIAPIRAQLSASNWSRIVDVVTRKEEIKNLEVYLSTDPAGDVNGLVVLGVEPKQLLFVNIVGMIDIEKLRKLEGSFGVPELEIEGGKTRKKDTSGAPQKKP